MRETLKENGVAVMANTNWDPEDDDDVDTSPPKASDAKGLRDHAKKVDRENAELKAKLAEFEQKQRIATVETTLKEKGYAPKIAGLVPSSISEADALEKWLDDNKDVFKPVKVKNTQQEEDMSFEDDDDDEGGLDPFTEESAASQRVSRVASSATSGTRGMDLMSQIKSASTRAELDALLRSQGNQFV